MNAVKEEELPEGWAEVALCDVVLNVPNVKPESEPGKEFGYVDISAIDNSQHTITETKRFRGVDAPSRARRPIQHGDVLFSNVRTYLRNIAIVPEGLNAQLCSTGFTVLRPSAAVDPRFLFRYTLTDRFIDAVTPHQTGTHYPATSDRVVLSQSFPLPPLAEQRRIVAKVEELLARVNAARERLAKVPAILKRFRQSILAAACSGQLTADWREANPSTAADEISAAHRLSVDNEAELPIVPESWAYARCDSLCDPDRSLTYGVIKLGPEVSGGIPTLRSSDVRWLRIDEAGIKSISPAIAKEYSRTFLKGGEIVVTVRGTLGGVAVVPRDMEGFNVSREVAVVPIQTRWIPEFFTLAIGSQWSQNWLTGVAKGVAYTGVNIADLKRLPLPVPPVPEQAEIVRRVEALFALADKIEARVQSATARVQKTTQAILAKAFRGELVPTEAELARRENRPYEPASALLARIHATRAAESNGAPRRKGGARNSDGRAQPASNDPKSVMAVKSDRKPAPAPRPAKSRVRTKS